MNSPSPSSVSGWAMAPVSALAGLAASASFMPFNVWPLAFVAVAVLVWTASRAGRLRAAVGQGWAFGLVFMGTSLVWQTEILILSYTALTVMMSAFYAGLGGALFAVRRLPAAPLWGAAAWTAMEWLTSVVPFGGFAWMRLGYTQLDSPLAAFYPLTGAASVTFWIALTGALLARLADAGRVRTGIALGLTAALVSAAALTGLPAASAPEQSVNVGWVQPGAPGGGVYGLGPARTITYNSAAETGRLMARVRAGDEPAPAFLVWPENSTDMDPRSDAPTLRAVESAVAGAGLGILVGSIYSDDAREERQTVAVWWDADGPELAYAKRNLVPFGEWIPFRDVLLPLIPELRYVGYQSVPGTTPGTFPVTLPDGREITGGVVICYEVVYPETVYQAARQAQVMIVQSSNAMYQGTIQIDQQFAATRVRAAEMRREILVVTTSGISGLIGTHGEVLERVPDSVPASGVHALPLRTGVTPAMVLSRFVEGALAAVGAVGVLLGMVTTARRRGDGTMDVQQRPASGRAKEN
ncbi:MAG: apolipoprotein N-acyltransferase [Propioniciclava sp.]|uniref:apolipoprotein N-acyltransferase n=1 Tax=Propioniciclava sp. TaxID=2038686 RepID=UPI0039E43983